MKQIICLNQTVYVSDIERLYKLGMREISYIKVFQYEVSKEVERRSRGIFETTSLKPTLIVKLDMTDFRMKIR